MSLIVMHLRWDDVDAEQDEHLRRVLPEGAQSGDGCLLRQRRRQGRAVLGTEVWIDHRAADRFLTGLPDLLGPAALPVPRCVAFAVPDCFAAGYGIYPGRAPRPTAGAGTVPAPRAADEAELPVPVPQPSHA